MTGDRSLWRRCRRLAAGPALPNPFDPRTFLDGIAATRGRPIEVLPAALVRRIVKARIAARRRPAPGRGAKRR